MRNSSSLDWLRFMHTPNDYRVSLTNTMQNYYETILNYFVSRETNAFAESFNAKIKAFRAQFRGVGDIPFFMLDYAN